MVGDVEKSLDTFALVAVCAFVIGLVFMVFIDGLGTPDPDPRHLVNRGLHLSKHIICGSS